MFGRATQKSPTEKVKKPCRNQSRKQRQPQKHQSWDLRKGRTFQLHWFILILPLIYIYMSVVKYCQHLNGIIEARHERQWQQVWRAPTTIDRTENSKCKANKDTNWPRPSPCNQSRLGTVETPPQGNLCNHFSLIFRKYKFLTNVVEQTKYGLLLAIHPASELSKASQFQISSKHHSQPFRLQQRQQVLLFFSLKRPFCPSSFQVTKTARKEVLDGEEMSILDIPDKSLGVSPARLLLLLCEGSALS